VGGVQHPVASNLGTDLVCQLRDEQQLGWVGQGCGNLVEQSDNIEAG
jgi:hypothetical protein